MSTTRQPTAKPPASPHPNLTVGKRVGVAKWGSVIWHVACACGKTMEAEAPAIKGGAAHCWACNPRRGMLQANAILAVLPAGYAKIVRKTGLTYGQVKYRIEWMRERELCFVGDHERPRRQGAIGPVFFAGAGADVPCTLEPRTRSSNERRYRKRVKRAVIKALAGGKEDPRYVHHIALGKAQQTAVRTRAAPQTPWSALFAVAGMGGAQHA